MEADRTFRRAAGERRRAGLARRLRRTDAASDQLAVHDGPATARGPGGACEIPLAAITGTIEPNRVASFDREFRPAPATRDRWLRVWIAVHGDGGLPPISVVRSGDGYAVLDGHHRVSVARASGAATIAAIVVG